MPVQAQGRSGIFTLKALAFTLRCNRCSVRPSWSRGAMSMFVHAHQGPRAMSARPSPRPISLCPKGDEPKPKPAPKPVPKGDEPKPTPTPKPAPKGDEPKGDQAGAPVQAQG